jgi:hypothetical protein
MLKDSGIIKSLREKISLTSVDRGRRIISGRHEQIRSLRQKLPPISKDGLVSKGKDLLPRQYETFSNIRQNIRLPEISKDHIIRKGKDLLDSRVYYETLFYSKISNYSIPSLSEMYANSKFKTSIYRASEPSPCLDEIFYKHENLIPYGKEYWFAIFTSPEGRKPMQLVSCFGRRNSRRSIVDDIEVNGLNPTDGVLSTGAFAWCHDGKKKLLTPPLPTQTMTDGRSIATTGREFSMTISGTVPEYRVRIDSDAISCDFRLTKPGSGYDEEILNELKMGLNFQVYNLYYNFTGTLNDKEYSGRCYLQKVILSTPLVPWYWCRLVFGDGSFLVFFKPYFGSKEFNYPLRNKGVFYSAKHDRLFWFYNIDVTSDGRSHWWFRSRGDDYALDIMVKSYADHRFSFRSGGAFNYHEYMVNVRKFSFQSGDVRVKYRDLGPGAGLVEDATGILI